MTVQVYQDEVAFRVSASHPSWFAMMEMQLLIVEERHLDIHS